MAEAEPDRPLYGHFGPGTYSDEEQQWTFRRQVSPLRTFHILDEPSVLAKSVSENADSAHRLGTKEGQMKRIRKQAKALITDFPELQPASELLPELVRLSEAVEDAANCHDTSLGNLLTVGTISNQMTRLRDQVMAFPCGPTASDLRVMVLRDEARGWSDSKTDWLNCSTADSLHATWKGPGVPIRSINFERRRDRGEQLLVVQLAVDTIIFRPVIREDSRRRSSKLDLDILLRLAIEETGNQSHVHLSCNPWHSRQLAIIDEAGAWSVQEWGGGLTSSSGAIFNSNVLSDLSSAPSLSMEDRWARIAWISNRTLVICVRSVAFVYNIDTETVEVLAKPKIVLDSGPGWNLDMIILPLLSDHVVLLTSDHIILYRSDNSYHDGQRLSAVASFRHYRNPEDISMRLSICQNDQHALLCIRSRLKAAVTIFILEPHVDGSLSVSDPTDILLIPFGQSGGEDVKVSDILVRHIAVEHGDKLTSGRSKLSRLINRGYHFYSVICLWDDHSVTQTLVYSAPGSANGRGRIAPTSWKRAAKTSKIRKSKKWVSERASGIPEDDDFIERDSSDLDHNCHDQVQGEPVSNAVRARLATPVNSTEKDWTVNFEIVAQMLDNVDFGEGYDAEDLVQATRETLSGQETSDSRPFRTLAELAAGTITVSDNSSITAALQQLVDLPAPPVDMETPADHTEFTPYLALRRVAIPESVRSGPCQHLNDFEATLEAISRIWLMPSDDSLSLRTLKFKEKLVEQVAAELVLAGHALRLEMPARIEDDNIPNQGESLELPMVAAIVASPRSTPSVYFDASSQPQTPTQANRSTPSSATPSTITSSSRGPNLAADAVSRLSQYTTFSKPDRPPLPRSLNRVLSHWDPGTNPSTYDWTSTSKHLSRQDQEAAEADGMTEQERRRRERRADRYLRRQRRENEESQRLRALSSQAPEIVSASQPTQDVLPSGQDSLPLRSSQLAASQTVPGRHAARRPGRKKRKSGF